MATIKRFPKIKSIVQLAKDIKSRCDYSGWDYPVLDFTGTVKLHGTNAGISFTNNGDIFVQSRNISKRLNESEHFHRGFGEFAIENIDYIKSILPETNNNITIYGEWFGQGIQKGVGISSLSKRWIIFCIREWVHSDNESSIYHNVPDIYEDEKRIFSVSHFRTFDISIDFNNISLEKINKITDDVAKSCPISLYFGSSGYGEGIVWTCKNDGWLNCWFKSKSEKFKEKTSYPQTNPKKSNEYDNNIVLFCESVINENRLLKGIDFLLESNRDIDIRLTGKFISWVVDDINQEEADEIENLNKKQVNKLLGTLSRKWLFEYLEKTIND